MLWPQRAWNNAPDPRAATAISSVWRPGSHIRTRNHRGEKVPLHFLRLRTFQNTQEGAAASDHAYPGRHPQQEPWSSCAASQSRFLGDVDAQTSVPHTGLLKNPLLLTTHQTERQIYREGVWSALKGPREASGTLREKAGPGQALWQSCQADDGPC